MSNREFPICENCGQRNSLWYVVFPGNNGFPYLQVCKVCIADIGSWADELKEMCDDEYRWNGEVRDGGGELLWSEERGQLYKPESDER